MTSGDLPPGWMDIDFGAPLRGRVKALMSARAGGVSKAPYALCNLGDHVHDDPRDVARNRALFGGHLSGLSSASEAAQATANLAAQAEVAAQQAGPVQPVWMTQVHGHRIVRLTHARLPQADAGSASAAGLDLVNPAALSAQPVADGAITTEPGLACAVMVADCLPVLLVAPEGRGVAALHAGWRGLAGAGGMAGQGIVHAGVRALCEATSADPADLLAWLGPCIGLAHFEVGADVLTGFGVDPLAGVDPPRFIRVAGPGAAPGSALSSEPAPAKWLADLPGLAQDILHALGVHHVSGGTWCTVSAPSRFFSFRRDRVTGRQAAGICLR